MKKRLVVYMNEDVIKKLEKEGKKRGITKNMFARSILYKYFNKKGA